MNQADSRDGNPQHAKEATPIPFREARIEGHQFGRIKRLSGFRKGRHFVPETQSEAAGSFVARAGADELRQQAEAIYGELKTRFNWRRREMAYHLSEGEATIETPDFTVAIVLDQDEDNPGLYRLFTRVVRFQRPEVVEKDAFAAVFAPYCNRVVLEFTRPVQVADKIDALEEVDAWREHLEYAPDASMMTLELREAGLHLAMSSQEAVFARLGRPDLSQLISDVRQALAALAEKGIALRG